MNEQKTLDIDKVEENTSDKVIYETPKIVYLGKLSSLIQGISGSVRDNFPQQGSKMA